MPLTWEASYEIALHLIQTYPETDPDAVSIGQLYDWVLALPEFDDDPLLVNDKLLHDILREWYEEKNAL